MLEEITCALSSDSRLGPRTRADQKKPQEREKKEGKNLLSRPAAAMPKILCDLAVLSGRRTSVGESKTYFNPLPSVSSTGAMFE